MPEHLISPGDTASAASPLNVAQAGTLVDVALTVDTSIYASGDVLSDTATITNAVAENGGRARVVSVTVIDEDDQGQAFDIIFFTATQSLGTKNAAPSISDAAARDAAGMAQILTTDYSDLGGVRVATKGGLDILLKAAAASRDLFLGTIVRSGTPTYTAAGLRLRIGLQWM
jgi:hypothetical protein